MTLKLSEHPTLHQLKCQYLPHNPKKYLETLEKYYGEMDRLRFLYIRQAWKNRSQALLTRQKREQAPKCRTEGCENRTSAQYFRTCLECNRKFRQCTRKHRYNSFLHAQICLIFLKLIGYAKTTSIIYRCDHCAGMHMSSKSHYLDLHPELLVNSTKYQEFVFSGSQIKELSTNEP